jgi:hypothetical protein
VSRTPSAQLPVYLLAKRGGNLHQTRIKKVAGDVNAFVKDLEQYLREEAGVPEQYLKVHVNRLTGHVIVKVGIIPEQLRHSFYITNDYQGWHKDTVDAFLRGRNF